MYNDRLFIERRLLPSGTSYQFHPLFRNFLLARLASSRASADVAAMKTRAAQSLEKRGILESATAVALECDDPLLLARLILAQAPSMVAQGRLTTLESWLLAVPEPIREGNGWLLYWLGVSSSLRDMTLGRACLERSLPPVPMRRRHPWHLAGGCEHHSKPLHGVGLGCESSALAVG